LGFSRSSDAELKARGAQIHLGPPESQGSGGTVPRPTKDGSPRPKLEQSIFPRLRQTSCRRRTLCSSWLIGTCPAPSIITCTPRAHAPSISPDRLELGELSRSRARSPARGCSRSKPGVSRASDRRVHNTGGGTVVVRSLRGGTSTPPTPRRRSDSSAGRRRHCRPPRESTGPPPRRLLTRF
jgi:hypothetical protein